MHKHRAHKQPMIKKRYEIMESFKRGRDLELRILRKSSRETCHWKWLFKDEEFGRQAFSESWSSLSESKERKLQEFWEQCLVSSWAGMHGRHRQTMS